jgi:methylated-DNA-[protein]-cysteine S-methyltransferase
MRPAIDKRIQSEFGEYEEGSTPIIEETIVQLEAYFQGIRTEFDLPLAFAGTDFQKAVWNALMQIPYGKTGTYLGLSRALGDEKAIRAVATANGANALSIVVPCHRIIGSDGDLVGYAGGLSAKKKLLELENPNRGEQLGLF